MPPPWQGLSNERGRGGDLSALGSAEGRTPRWAVPEAMSLHLSNRGRDARTTAYSPVAGMFGVAASSRRLNAAGRSPRQTSGGQRPRGRPARPFRAHNPRALSRTTFVTPRRGCGGVSVAGPSARPPREAPTARGPCRLSTWRGTPSSPGGSTDGSRGAADRKMLGQQVTTVRSSTVIPTNAAHAARQYDPPVTV
jgi:hypothetical protein